MQFSLVEALAALGGIGGVLGAGLPLAEAVALQTSNSVHPVRRAKLVVVGGHPDDPESGCGGTMARFADLGHEVVALYLTRGEAGIAGKSHEQAAAIRTAECLEACKILKARPVFAGQIDGSSEINATRYAHHDMMNRFRGLESGHKYAEAFIRHVQSKGGLNS